MYLPRTRYKVSNTPGNFLKKADGTFYVGPYIETFNGRYFTGTTPQTAGEELTPPVTAPDQQLLVNFYPSPIENDYSRGYFTRYFAYYIVTGRTLEVNRSNYIKLSKQQEYTTTSVRWELTGDTITTYSGITSKDKAVAANSNTLDTLVTEYPSIKSFVSPEQFVR